MNALEPDSDWRISLHVHNKIIAIGCGEGSQRIKWAAHVAIGKPRDSITSSAVLCDICCVTFLFFLYICHADNSCCDFVCSQPSGMIKKTKGGNI